MQTNNYPFKSIRECLGHYIKILDEAIKRNMEAKGRNASFRSVKSLRPVVENDEHAYLEGLSSFVVMERGRRGGKVPYGFVGIIRQWILDKGIPVKLIPSKRWRPNEKSPYERGLDRMAGAIAHKIMTSGTRLHRQKGFDDIFTSKIEEIMSQLERDLMLWAEVEFDRLHQEEQ